MKILYVFLVVFLVVLHIVNSENEKNDNFDLKIEEKASVRDNDSMCGENVVWSFDSITKTLAITGNGEMDDYTVDLARPWLQYSDEIEFITIEEGVTSIGNLSFSDLSFLKSVNIPKTVRYIGAYAFSSCSELADVILPDNLAFIGDGAFFTCTGLTTITIPGSVTLIEKQAFGACSHLENVTMNYGVNTISDFCFFGCTFLKHVVIPDSVISIGSFAFSQCPNLTSLVIPESVSSIGNNAFFGCEQLRSIFYMGSQELAANPFLTEKPSTVCVPPDYNSTQFCGLDVTSSAECQSFQVLFNHCFKAKYINGVFRQEKRQNVTEWERRTNQCKQYQCDIAKGGVSWSICNSSGNVIRKCSNDLCVENVLNWTVVIVLSEGVKEDEVSLTELLETITTLCGTSSEDILLGFNTDESGFIVSFMVYVIDEQTANVTLQKISTIDKGEGCKFGTLCRKKEVFVKGNILEFSASQRLNGTMVIWKIALLLSLFLLKEYRFSVV